MIKKNYNIAVYVDMENMASVDFVLENVMSSLLTVEDEYNCIAVIKSAYGDQEGANKRLKKQLVEHNFNIVDIQNTNVVNSRAELLLSLDSFETLYLDNPKIDRYCFMTSYSNFTAIADKLRKFGREAWLVCKSSDREQAILGKSFDNLLFVEDFSYEKEAELFIEPVKDMNYRELSFYDYAVNNMNYSGPPSHCSLANHGIKKINYIAKPYQVRASSERIKRKLDQYLVECQQIKDLESDRFYLSYQYSSLFYNEVKVRLIPSEYELLDILSDAMQPILVSSLFEKIHGFSYYEEDRSIYMRISSLRKKLAVQLPGIELIKNRRSKGFFLSQSLIKL
ncbi:NYN domain-containing protein [Moritella sp. 5]|uniref:NYN domain-containing protein n=1 Tax=Moritella sp. 5 TaxID=2746231 RepID=UPI0020121FBA|nr:NYN domain-containing protein [Moritella sp. 5]